MNDVPSSTVVRELEAKIGQLKHENRTMLDRLQSLAAERDRWMCVRKQDVQAAHLSSMSGMERQIAQQDRALAAYRSDADASRVVIENLRDVIHRQLAEIEELRAEAAKKAARKKKART